MISKIELISKASKPKVFNVGDVYEDSDGDGLLICFERYNLFNGFLFRDGNFVGVFSHTKKFLTEECKLVGRLKEMPTFVIEEV